MDSIASWNVRGLNRPLKQREVQQIVSEHHLNVCAILESHVQVSNLSKVCCGVFKKWDWTSNGGICNRGTRIIVGWNNEMVDLMVLAQTEQVMHVQLVSKIDSKTLFCSFVYAKNTYQERRDLWKDLCKHKQMMEDKPWIVMGDFNSALYVDDYLYGTSIPSIGMREFFECVQYNELVDIQGHGLHFTWNQKPRKGVGILKKIDRVMGNMKFLDMVPEAYVLYHPYRVSDHTPCILRMKSLTRVKPKPFKFANFIASKDGFKPCVNEEWANRVEGIPMFSVVKKLRNLKTPLRKLMFEQGNLHDKVTKLRLKLDEIHKQIDRNPLDTNLRDTEAKVIKDFHSAAYDEESFLKQKAKIDWLCAGDANTTYFHNYVKHKNARSKIHSISDVRGNHFEGTDVETALVNHYATFLGKEDRVDELNMENLFVNVIHPEAALQMIRQVTREEVIKGKNFWDIPYRGSLSWGWRKLLSIRETIRPFIWYAIGDGCHTNAWMDNWCACSPLREFITPRRIHNAGFSMQSTVSDIVDDLGSWKWPTAWNDLFPILNNLDPPNFDHNVGDKLFWKDNQGNQRHFSSGEVWNNIRLRGEEVSWEDLVWFGQCIPRHSFHMWLVIKNKLKTQDRMGVWDAGSATNLNLMCCPLCRYDKDSRDHLFFQCPFASQVWNEVKDFAYMERVNASWKSIMASLEQYSRSKSAQNVVRKMVVAASTYFIWQERNNRLFSENKRSSSMIANVILHTVRLKLMSFKVGRNTKNPLMLEKWKTQVKTLDIDPG
ncbi:hypothetical protein L1987_01835 [Smallanthus sonchifolius]|uniref:Uncharacterized protein n=1 Tax=Smallanthus sonchifolius TaxID=185202 RepID=A0ACB9K656_9ASTR|nr:hypothetical protein L1987_01835 [Smallanthus sonchifolius]